jgi:hypothetical protein
MWFDAGMRGHDIELAIDMKMAIDPCVSEWYR